MTSPTDNTAPLPKPRRRWRWVKRIGIVLLVIPFGTVAVLGLEWKLTNRAGRKKLDPVISRLDTEDHGWRIEDIVAAHNAKVPPDETNTAMKALSIVKRFPENPLLFKTLIDILNIDRTSINERILEKSWNHIADLIEPLWVQLVDDLQSWNAAKPQGRFPIRYNGGDPASMREQGTVELRKVKYPLMWGGMQSANRNTAEHALRDAVVGLRLILSIESEPTVDARLTQIEIGHSSLDALEQLLAWRSDVGDSDLATVQQLVWNERNRVPLQTMIRAERATAVKEMDYIGCYHTVGGWREYSPGGLERHWNRRHQPANTAACLELYDDLFQELALPSERFFSTYWPKLLPSKTVENDTALFIFAPIRKAIKSDVQYRSRCICVAAGIACERYRIKHGRWPATLDALAAYGINEGLIDLCTGKPLGYTVDENRVTIFSIGDTVERPDFNQRIGIRLWSVNARKIPNPIADFDGNN